MTQPSFVPIAEADQVRPARRLAVPAPWSPERPAELRGAAQPSGRALGTPGPDQGFALRLAHRLLEELHLGAGESPEDVAEGLALVAARRAGLFGRAPCIFDLRLAAGLFGFLGDAPDDLVAERTARFRAVSHDYVVQRDLVDGVPEEALRLSPDEAAARGAADWRALLTPGGTAAGRG